MSDDKKLSELNKMYEDAISADKDVFAEQRSNVLLIAGDHYAKKNWKWLAHVREQSALSDEQKIRITKNHVNRIYKAYVNKIVSMSPGVTIDPRNEKELQDVKAAELHNSVLAYYKDELDFDSLVPQLAGDFCGIGEVVVQIDWDWEKGYIKRKEQVSEPVTNEQGDVLHTNTKENVVWSGMPVITRHFAFNVFRPSACQSLKDAPWLGVQKMANVADLKRKYGEEPEKLKAIEPDGKTTFLVFEQNEASYREKKDQVLVKEVYYKPSPEYPKGYFYYFTTGGILEEGELPMGKWNFAIAGFDEIPTHPRKRSFIRQIKPYQIELNRVGSKIAEHQITLGDDKVIMSHGGKMSSGGNMPGIRAVSVTGQNPIILPGRTGEQYLGYMSNTITEMYQVAMVSEELEDKTPAQIDPYALLMASSKWKTRFSTHTQAFEKFLVEIARLLLETVRFYIEEDELIYVIGRGERVNISEFKNAQELCYQIKAEEQSEDVESRVGRKMSMDRYIQYAGANMDREDIGKFIRNDPYLNKEQIFSDFTLAYDNAENDILMLDRGQMPQMNKYRYPKVEYIIGKLSNRMGQADFQFLPPQVQQMYQQVLAQYEALIQQQIQEQAALNSQYIPSGGGLIRTDMWIPDPSSPTGKQMRASVPYESLAWLLDRLGKQGMTQEALKQQQQAVVSDIAGRIQANAQARAQVPPQAQAPATPQEMLKQKLQQMSPGQG